MKHFTVTVKQHVGFTHPKNQRRVSYWLAWIEGVPGEFKGRTKAEAVGRAVVHLVAEADAERQYADHIPRTADGGKGAA